MGNKENEPEKKPDHIPTRVGNSLFFEISRIITAEGEESIYEVIAENADEVIASEKQLKDWGYPILDLDDIDRISVGDFCIGPVNLNTDVFDLPAQLTIYKFIRGPVGITEDRDLFPDLVVKESNFPFLSSDRQIPGEER